MRIGRVVFTMSSVVDLDNEKMVEAAKQLLIEDIEAAARDYSVAYDLIAEVKSSKLSEEDIPFYLQEYKPHEEPNEEGILVLEVRTKP